MTRLSPNSFSLSPPETVKRLGTEQYEQIIPKNICIAKHINITKLAYEDSSDKSFNAGQLHDRKIE